MVLLIKTPKTAEDSDSESEQEIFDRKLCLVPWIDLSKIVTLKSQNCVSLQEVNELRQSLLQTQTLDPFEPALVKKKEAIIEGLKSHQLKVFETEGQKISIQDGLAVLPPPYRPQDLVSNNVIILDRVTELLNKCNVWLEKAILEVEDCKDKVKFVMVFILERAKRAQVVKGIVSQR